MAEPSPNANTKKIYRPRYATLIALFAAISFIFQAIGNVVEVAVTRNLYQQFKVDYPDQSKTFQWAFASTSHLSIPEIIGSGLAMFFLLLLLTHFCYRVQNGEHKKYHILEKSKGKAAVIGDLAIISVYLVVFGLYFYVNDPMSLQRPLNWVWALSFALVCGASAHLLLLHDHLRDQRLTGTREVLKKEEHKWDFLKYSYEIELSEYQSAISNLIWISASLGAGLIFSSVLQYTFALPTGISFSNEFSIIIVVYFFELLILIFGLILGLIYQLLFEMHAIVALVRSKAA